MLELLTSLSFLYGLTIFILVVLSISYYNRLSKKGKYLNKKWFLISFSLINLCSFLFLFLNFNLPLNLKTYSNLDHYFIQHDGFSVTGSIELGNSDTSYNKSNPFNQFLLLKNKNVINISSRYSEEPFYYNAGSAEKFNILSVNFPIQNNSIAFHAGSTSCILKADHLNYHLTFNSSASYTVKKDIKIGTNAWNLFKDEKAFVNSEDYSNETIVNCLRNIFILKDEISKEDTGHLKYFLSARLFNYSTEVTYNEAPITINQIAFHAIIPDKTTITWGIGLPGNNKNQYLVYNLPGDTFKVINRFPVSYPLSEEEKENWTKHTVNKFLVSDDKDIIRIAPVFREGFLFNFFKQNNLSGFAPLLLSFQKGGSNEPLKLKVSSLNGRNSKTTLVGDQLNLPSLSGNFLWLFSLKNSFNWQFSTRLLTPADWKFQIGLVMCFFFLLVFLSAVIIPSYRINFIWQLLSCITVVLLITRIFLYWRYKSFPPFEGLDLPSQQQLQSIWNLRIILLTGLLLSIIFGYGFLHFIINLGKSRIEKFFGRNFSLHSLAKIKSDIYPTFLFRNKFYFFFNNLKKKYFFLLSWLSILAAAFFIVNILGWERHITVALILVYFIFLYISYKHSPLVSVSENAWWKVDPSQTLSILLSNPIKIILSISLLIVYVFIDIGFAIIFINFLLFHEAWICFNYSVGGLSAGSKRNAAIFGSAGFFYLAVFIGNLLYAPYILNYWLDLPGKYFTIPVIIFTAIIAIIFLHLLDFKSARRKQIIGVVVAGLIIAGISLFMSKESILQKAETTKYRINVLAMPIEKAIQQAYLEGKTSAPVIQAAQNQWFINTFIFEKNNPRVNYFSFHLLPHAPQNKGAKYNAQATDLVSSRFLIAEHGKSSVLLYAFILLIPSIILGSFYKLYPDFTRRTNMNYPTITIGFTILNYLFTGALLVIFAATGKYIFFGQDLAYAAILSKYSILFPTLLIITIVFLLKKIPIQYYSNRLKLLPGLSVFLLLVVVLLFVKPVYNNNKEFNVGSLMQDLESFIELRIQPILTYYDTSSRTKKFPLARKDQLLKDSVNHLFTLGLFSSNTAFFNKVISDYANSAFSDHLNQNRILHLENNSGEVTLSVNNNYFRIQPPPHLQNSWLGNIYGDSTIYNIVLWNSQLEQLINKRIAGNTDNFLRFKIDPSVFISYAEGISQKYSGNLYLVNTDSLSLKLRIENKSINLKPGDSIKLFNPCKVLINNHGEYNSTLIIEPDAFMKNYYVNGNRFYVYPLGNRFIWARNFSEGISKEYAERNLYEKNAFISFDFAMTDSLTLKIRQTLLNDTAYKNKAEYGICIADGYGRVLAMSDFIKGLDRPDPNDKTEFNDVIYNENGIISQAFLRKQVGNINLLRMNPGPGSTLKPIVFSSIASQLNLNWNLFESEGFSGKLQYFGGEKVAEYDFEEPNGLITDITNYLRVSDNYYHSNVLLLGSYPRKKIQDILRNYFSTSNTDIGIRWPNFKYNSKKYWLDGFKNWPGFSNGKANFGSDSSFVSIGLLRNYQIYNHLIRNNYELFRFTYDSSLFFNAYKNSSFILPEYGLFDQQGNNINATIPYDVFANCFRGHVKGSSQVLIPPLKMVEAFGKLISQNRNYSLTLNPYNHSMKYLPFYIDSSIRFNDYLGLMQENVFSGMKEALLNGTARKLGILLSNGAPYYYYAKTGTTGDINTKTKSKLLCLVISLNDITDLDTNLRTNKFYIIYFTSQNGPNKQNEEFQKEIIRFVERSAVFNRYMRN